MLPLKFLLTHYDAAERLSEIHTLLAEDPDFKWILAECYPLCYIPLKYVLRMHSKSNFFSHKIFNLHLISER